MARIRWHSQQITLTAQRLAMPMHQRYSRDVVNGALRLAPQAAEHASGSGRPRPGEPLRQSIFGLVTMTSASIKTRIGTRKNYAASVHQGSDSHIIRGRGGRMLKFRWERGDFLVAARAGRRRGNRRTGQFHYFAQVRHPGNRRPVQFLTRPLHMYARFYGYQVISFLAAARPLP